MQELIGNETAAAFTPNPARTVIHFHFIERADQRKCHYSFCSRYRLALKTEMWKNTQ